MYVVCVHEFLPCISPPSLYNSLSYSMNVAPSPLQPSGVVSCMYVNDHTFEKKFFFFCSVCVCVKDCDYLDYGASRLSAQITSITSTSKALLYIAHNILVYT